MNLLGHSAQEIQNHLYQAFLSGDAADISVRIGGSWNAEYKLHRLVLTQAGYFRSLFISGFSESSSNSSVNNGQVQIQFDDPNITRAAFELCIARLYGGGPALHISASLRSTLNEPLTSAYTNPTDYVAPSPPGAHICTPRFLLSLLSTAFHLSVPGLASEVLQLILSSVGPFTVAAYLKYALGQGIGEAASDEPERVITLEKIGEDIDLPLSQNTSSIVVEDSSTSDDDDANSKLGEMSLHDRTPTSSSISPQSNGPVYSYGVVSNRIGEACASFLTRWGADLLAREEIEISQEEIPGAPISISHHVYHPHSLRIWSRELPADWVRGIISSDEFFVRGELERYDVARRVVELRRRLNGIVPKDEIQFRRLFAEGIYYSHMMWEDLLRISEDRSLVTNEPFVSLPHLHSAHWAFSKMRYLITTNRSPSVSSATLTGSDNQSGQELGIALELGQILEKSNKEDIASTYWPVPIDTSVRIGEQASTASNEELFNPTSRDKTGQRPLTVQNFFGIGSARKTTEECSNSTKGVDSNVKWVPHEPFRFSVEFWGVDSLKEKSRMHSQTIWYAGSCYNVYTQAVRKKGLQLGVYLHRQSLVDPIPVPSRPRAPSNLTSTSTTIASPSTPPYSTSPPPTRSLSNPSLERTTSRTTIPTTPRNIPLRSTTPSSGIRSPRYIHSNASFGHSSPGTPVGSPSSPNINLSGTLTPPLISPPPQPYRDPRSAISAYFSICCHSATGSSLTRFSSAPDTFKISQSWGWKSSSLDLGDTDDNPEKELSLRATVVIGLV